MSLIITSCILSQSNFSTVLTAEKFSFEVGEKVELLFSVKNISDSEVKFCDYHTPFEGIRNNILIIKGPNNSALPYRGIMAKRAKPNKDNNRKVKSDSVLSTVFHTNDAYDILAKGTYRITFKGNESINGLPDSNTLEIEIK